MTDTPPISDAEIAEINDLEARHTAMCMAAGSTNRDIFIAWDPTLHDEYIRKLQIFTPRLIAELTRLRAERDAAQRGEQTWRSAHADASRMLELAECRITELRGVQAGMVTKGWQAWAKQVSAFLFTFQDEGTWHSADAMVLQKQFDQIATATPVAQPLGEGAIARALCCGPQCNASGKEGDKCRAMVINVEKRRAVLSALSATPPPDTRAQIESALLKAATEMEAEGRAQLHNDFGQIRNYYAGFDLSELAKRTAAIFSPSMPGVGVKGEDER